MSKLIYPRGIIWIIMKMHKKLLVGVLLFALTLAFSVPLEVHAYDADDINRNRATSKYKFDDKNASVISMNIEGRTETFKRKPVEPGTSPFGTVIQPTTYKYELQGDTDDNCRQGTLVNNPVPRAYIASISIAASNIDSNPDPNKIDGTLLFFHKDGDKCTNKDIQGAIQINNPFGAQLSIPSAERVNPSATDEAGDNISCETTDSGPLGWILCPVIELAASFTEFVFEKFVQPFLEDVPVTTDETDGSYQAWKSFRLIGNIVLVGTMIAVVYAQVRGDR